MKCESCGKIARQKKIEKGRWVRFRVCDMDGVLVYELPMCAECAEKWMRLVYEAKGANDNAD